MTKRTGLLACASYMPGVRRNYWEGSRSSQILGGIHEATDDRACFTRWRLAQRNAPNTRQVVQVHWPEGHPTRVQRPCDISRIAQAFYEGKARGQSSPRLQAAG